MSEHTPPPISPEDVLRGIIAALAKRGNRSNLVASQPEVHRAFYCVLLQLRRLKKEGKIDVNLLDVDFDPLYGQSGWLDRALMSAQRDMLISFPNPSYDRIEIRYQADEAAKVLERIGHAEVLTDLADTFSNSLRVAA